MESWKKERAKIRSSRVFEDDIEFKPYEPKKFDDISIRPAWETRQKELKLDEKPGWLEILIGKIWAKKCVMHVFY